MDAAALGGMPLRAPSAGAASDGSDSSDSDAAGSSSSSSAPASQGADSSPPPSDTQSSFVPRTPMAMLVRDVAGFAALGYAEVPMMVLGMDLLGQGRLVLQLASQRVFVKEPSEFEAEDQGPSGGVAL